MTNSKTHWRYADYRAESLNQIITGLNSSIETLRKRIDVIDWYDGLWLLEDTEPIFGIAFIAFQNYINGSIKDLYESIENRTSYYKIGPSCKEYKKTYIELIIGLANYIKHQDDEKLHKGTQNILDAFNLEPSRKIEESPIFEGLSILNENWDLFKIYEIVKEWRENLFENYIAKLPLSVD